MKRKEIKELHTKDKAELEKMIEDAKSALVKLKMELATGKTKNVRLLSRKKDEIAQILTILEEKRNPPAGGEETK